MAKNRQNADFIVSTVRLHAVHIPEQSKRIIHAAQQQRAVHNRTVEHLLNHQSDEPLQKSTANGITGLFGRWPDWKTENEAAADTPSLVARGAISAARDQVAKWETTNLEHAVLIAKAQINDEPIPRRVQHRTPKPERLMRSRKREERQGRHRVRIDQNVRRIDRRTVKIPGIGELRTKDNIPEDLDIRSCVILERTPRARLKPGLEATKRTFRIHVTGRLPKPTPKNDDTGTACGIDHGVVTAMTVADSEDNVLSFQHDLKLTYKKVRQVGPGRYSDGRGLRLVVLDRGGPRLWRYWTQRLVIRKIRRDLGIGTVDDVTLAEAREIAEKNQKIARRGGDPRVEAVREKNATFAQMYEVVTKNRSKNWETRGTGAAWVRMFKHDVLPTLGPMPVADITIEDIRVIVEPHWKGRGTKGSLVRQNIESVFAWAVGNGYRPDNPAANLKGILSPVRRIVKH